MKNKSIFVLLLGLFISGNCESARLYMEMGSSYSGDRLYYFAENGKRFEQSGKNGRFATGIVFESGRFITDVQYLHESDLKFSNEEDISSKESLSVNVRYYFLEFLRD